MTVGARKFLKHRASSLCSLRKTRQSTTLHAARDRYPGHPSLFALKQVAPSVVNTRGAVCFWFYAARIVCREDTPPNSSTSSEILVITQGSGVVCKSTLAST